MANQHKHMALYHKHMALYHRHMSHLHNHMANQNGATTSILSHPCSFTAIYDWLMVVEKNENLKVMVVSLYRPSSAYYSSRSSFCCKEQADANAPADQLFSFSSNEPCVYGNQPSAYANQPCVCIFKDAKKISFQVTMRDLPDPSHKTKGCRKVFKCVVTKTTLWLSFRKLSKSSALTTILGPL